MTTELGDIGYVKGSTNCPRVQDPRTRNVNLHHYVDGHTVDRQRRYRKVSNLLASSNPHAEQDVGNVVDDVRNTAQDSSIRDSSKDASEQQVV